jgi:hypothetical protein
MQEYLFEHACLCASHGRQRGVTPNKHVPGNVEDTGEVRGCRCVHHPPLNDVHTRLLLLPTARPAPGAAQPAPPVDTSWGWAAGWAHIQGAASSRD